MIVSMWACCLCLVPLTPSGSVGRTCSSTEDSVLRRCFWQTPIRFDPPRWPERRFCSSAVVASSTSSFLLTTLRSDGGSHKTGGAISEPAGRDFQSEQGSVNRSLQHRKVEVAPRIAFRTSPCRCRQVKRACWPIKPSDA